MNIAFQVQTFSALWFVIATAALACGYVAGLIHFRSLRRVAGGLAAGDWRAALLQILRMAILTVFLFAVTFAGAQALLAATAGIVLARHRVIRRSEAPQ